MIGWRVTPPADRIAVPPPVFGDDRGAAPRITPRPPGSRLDEDVDLAGSGHGQKPEAKETTKLLDTSITLATPTATRGTHGQPNFVAGRRSIDRLQDKIKREGQFQLADDDGNRFAFPKRHQITAADLALDVKAKPFEEALDRQVEARFQGHPRWRKRVALIRPAVEPRQRSQVRWRARTISAAARAELLRVAGGPSTRGRWPPQGARRGTSARRGRHSLGEWARAIGERAAIPAAGRCHAPDRLAEACWATLFPVSGLREPASSFLPYCPAYHRRRSLD